MKKVWGDEPESGHALKAVASQQTLMFRRASINAISRRLVALSKLERLSARTRRKIETFRNYVLHNYNQLPVAVAVTASTVPPAKPVDSVKVPVAPHLSGAPNMRRELAKSNPGSRVPSASKKEMNEGNGNSNSSASDKAKQAGANSKSSHEVKSAKSTQNNDLSGICTFLRVKTPPQPHHFDEPDRTVPLVADLPHRHRVLVDEHTHVGSIFVDPSFFFLGEIHVKGLLEKAIEGFQNVEVDVSLSRVLLSAKQEERLRLSLQFL
jgi:hypothetical protein